MGRALPYLKRLWATDVALTTLLIFLLVYIFCLFPLRQFPPVRILSTLFFSLILATGALAATKNRVLRTLVLSWGLAAFAFLWARHAFPHHAFALLNTGLSLAFLLLLSLLILGQTFREGPTTSHRITGSVAVYLLLGLMWSLAYYLVALIVPDAFAVQGPYAANDRESLQSHLFYFSFITLTTLGYGDIVPVHPMARMLVILEGVTGQLFPAILIARLVSLHVQVKR